MAQTQRSFETLTQSGLNAAVAHLCAREPRFKTVIAQHGPPSLRAMTEGLEGLLATVTDQFLSLRAAAAIWARVKARCEPLSAACVLAVPQEELVVLGLSRAKAKSFHGIALAVASGAFNPDTLALLPDDEARKALITLPGVGPWTADIYLLAALLRADAWPTGDLALQVSAQDLFGLRQRPDATAMMILGAHFQPYRAVAARLLWSHYRGLKAMAQA